MEVNEDHVDIIKDNQQISKNSDDKDDDEISMSSYEADQADSLIIKPPQAVSKRRDNRDKRDRRDKHKHKSDKYKEKIRHRDRISRHEERERRRELKKNRGIDRRSLKHLEKKSRRSKRERLSSGDHRKLEKERGDRERRKDREHRGGNDEFVMDNREMYEFKQYSNRGHGSHHRDHRFEERGFMSQNLMQLHISPPREKTDRDKRMEKFMLAEKQKEITNREAHARRIRREESRIEELRMRAEASMRRHAAAKRNSPPDRSESHRKKRSPVHAPPPDGEVPETVELISDEDLPMDESTERDANQKHRRRKRLKEVDQADDRAPADAVQPTPMTDTTEPTQNTNTGADLEDVSDKSSSSGDSSDSDDSSSTSGDDDDDESKDSENGHGESPKIKAVKNPSDKASGTGSSAGSTDDEKGPDSEREEDNNDGDGGSLSESPVPSPPELKQQLPFYYPAVMGCRSVDEFECLNRIEEGTYGVVYRAREKATDEIVALKRLKMEKEKEGFPITSLREVNTLLKGQHENIVTVREIVVGSNMDKIYIVMDYVEHDLKSLMETMKKKKQSFTIGEVKTLMIQLLRAVRHLHDNWILHRDLKTSNLLLSHRGILKVGDFGLAREYGSPLKQYTPIVVTLWYRAPELLLGTKEYSCPIDIWSCGCIFGELLAMEPMFPGKSEIDQLNKIFKDLGTPSDKIWPGYNDLPVTKKTQFAYFPYNHLKERFGSRLSEEGFSLFNGFLTYNPSKRLTAMESLAHAYFVAESPPPVAPSMFPTWPAKSECSSGTSRKKGDSPKPPSGGKNFKDLGDGEDENIAGFFLGGAPTGGPGFTLKF